MLNKRSDVVSRTRKMEQQVKQKEWNNRSNKKNGATQARGAIGQTRGMK
jgi:hypothetical protein